MEEFRIKRLFSFVMLFVILFLNLQSSATLDVKVEKLPGNTKPLSTKLSDDCYLVELDGKQYFFDKRPDNRKLIPYDEKEFNFFARDNFITDFFWTGEYYFARRNGSDEGGYHIGYKNIYNRVMIYDKNFNLIKKYEPGDYFLRIAYYNGTYYAKGTHRDYYNNNAIYSYKSKDFENWVKTTEEIPNDIPLTNGHVFFNKAINNVSFDGAKYYNVAFENKSKIKNISQKVCGEWIVNDAREEIDENGKKTEREIRSLSYDNVYTIDIPNYNFEYAYEYNDDVVMEFLLNSLSGEPLWRYTMPKQQLYDKLKKLKNPLYVKLNDKILGFEQPPVLESDRALVPMRFLFEQMGAQVSWDNDTRTATATKGDKVVSFSIDNTSASVNNAMKTMDVPARLVNDKTMIPLRFLSEELGYEVEWDEKTKVATIKEDN